MSGDSLRTKANRISGNVVRPQSVNEKTLIESVAGLINEVGLVPQHFSSGEDKENCILWTKLYRGGNGVFPDLNNSRGGNYSSSSTNSTSSNSSTTREENPPLLLALGYPSGLQIWRIPWSGEATELLTWRRPLIRFFQFLPIPADSDRDVYRGSRPVVAICEGSSNPSSSNVLNFVGLRTGESLKSIKFIHPVCDLLANSIAIVVALLDKILILDPCRFEQRHTISSSTLSTPDVNPIALGSTWLAYTEKKLVPSLQSSGGVESSGAQSYTATVLYAAKSLSKGLKGLGETVANSLTGHRMPIQPTPPPESQPGIVNILNLTELKDSEFSIANNCGGNNGSSSSALVAHFIAHYHHNVFAMSFDPSGLILLTADKEGTDFNVFRIHPHPLGPQLAAVHHLYVLHRGDTRAKVQDISFAPDSRWVAISTRRGTTHLFPLTPYGGPISVRTHTSHRLVNKLSRFHRSAGLDDTPTSGRSSPIVNAMPANSYPPHGSGLMGGCGGLNSGVGSSNSSKSFDLFHLGSPFPNPRFPPFSHPVVVPPLAQLRQSLINSPKSSPPTTGKNQAKGGSWEEIIVAMFESPRGWLLGSPPIVPPSSADNKRKKPPVDALFVITCTGILIEYSLEPSPASYIVKDKVSEDSPIELSVHARAQWIFSRPSFLKEPLSSHSNNIYLRSGCFSNNHNSLPSSGSADDGTNGDEGNDERWLSHVEIQTHSGPHRRLWMGPQFTFKIFNSTNSHKEGGSTGNIMDIETVELNVTNRPAKSNPVNMPSSSSLLPVVIEAGSGSSLEQSPRILDAYYGNSGSGGNIGIISETEPLPNDSQIKENLADAMLENYNNANSKDKGGCQSIGSCDDLSSVSSFDSNGLGVGQFLDATPSFCIDASIPFPD